MEIVENTRKLTPEERRRELRLETFRQLREMEMERKARADLEELQRIREEKEERDKETETLRRQRERVEQERRMQEAKQKEEQERRANQEKAPETQKEVQLKKEKIQWEKLMMVQKEPVTRPRYTISDLKKEQQRRREEAELCPMPRVEDKASSKCLMSEVKSLEQSRRKTLNNNWVGEQEKLHPNDSTCRTTAEETTLKSDSMYLICIRLSQIWYFCLFKASSFHALHLFLF